MLRLSSFLLIFLYLDPVFSKSVSVEIGVKFKSGHITLAEKDLGPINDLYSLLEKNKDLKVYVFGHTDSLGDKVFNQDLSKKRAEFVGSNLIKMGVLKENLFVKGMGESAPIATNKTKVGRIKNRRVVVTFLNLDDKQEKDLKLSLNEYSSLFEVKEENSAVLNLIKEEEVTAEAVNQTDSKSNKGVEEVSIKSQKVENQFLGHQDKLKLRYSIDLGLYYNVLDVEDLNNSGSSAEWISNINFRLGGALQFNVSKLWIGIKIFGHQQDYKKEKSSIYTWDEENPFLVRTSFISDYESDRWGVGLDLNYNQEAFLYEQGGAVTLKDEFMFGLSVRGKYRWYETEASSSRVFAGLSFPFAGGDSDIDSEGSLGGQVALDFRKNNFFKKHDLTFKVYYEIRNFGNQQNDQDEQVLGMLFSLNSKNWL